MRQAAGNKFTSEERRDGIKKTCQRVFQALRIDVNSEYEALETFLKKLPEVTAEGARIAILTFPPGEERLVTQACREGRKSGVDKEIAEVVIRR